ncbi:MAG TPA: outer membrane lipoprotein-sorting protein [Holophagaceae bacterium]|nr:outer membrane lipoprotein-sorting protein [Holophagaceae bacterium]
MRNLRSVVLVAAGVVSLGAQAPEAAKPFPGAEELLTAADRHRHPWASFQVEIGLKVTREEQRWRVHSRENGDARVDGLSEKEKGRSVLVLGDDMWLLLPNTKRPVRVSPQQRLLGPASGGDIARTRFQEDYSAEVTGEETVEGESCHRLELKARRPAVAFQKATLWVAKVGRRPVKAEFRMASGKLARTVRFKEGGVVQGRPVLRSMEVEGSGGKVELRFEKWAPEGVDPAMFKLPE